MTTSPSQDSTAGIRLEPPVVYAVPLVAGLLFHRWQSVLVTPPRFAKPIGIVLVLLGFSLCVAAVKTFRREGTSPLLDRPTTTLVTSGPYRFSRNPIYLGYTSLYLGISFWANSLWPVVLLPFVLWVMHRAVILREEAYLQGRFGDAYSAYCQQVRRWLGEPRPDARKNVDR